MRLTKLYLHMSLFEQRLVAVGWRVRDDHAVILTLSPKTFIQQYAESGKYHPYFCYEVYWLAKIISLMIGKTGNPHNRRQSMVIYEIVIDSKLSGITVNPLKMDWSKVISAQDVIGGGGGGFSLTLSSLVQNLCSGTEDRLQATPCSSGTVFSGQKRQLQVYALLLKGMKRKLQNHKSIPVSAVCLYLTPPFSKGNHYNSCSVVLFWAMSLSGITAVIFERVLLDIVF